MSYIDTVKKNQKKKLTYAEFVKNNSDILGTQNKQKDPFTAFEEASKKRKESLTTAEAVSRIKTEGFTAPGSLPDLGMPKLETTLGKNAVVSTDPNKAAKIYKEQRKAESIKNLPTALDNIKEYGFTAPGSLPDLGMQKTEHQKEYGKLTTTKRSLEELRRKNMEARPEIMKSGVLNDALQVAASPVVGIAQAAADTAISVSDLTRNLGLTDDNRFSEGLKALQESAVFRSPEDLQKYSPIESKAGSALYDFGYNAGRMAPTALVTMATGGTGAASKLLQSAATLLSAKGGSMRSALSEGATLDDASAYSTVMGTAEALSEVMFSPFEKVLGGFINQKTLTKVARKILPNFVDSKAGKIILGTAFNVIPQLGEGLEEAVVSFIEPYAKQQTYDPDAETATGKELLSSALTGFLYSLGYSALLGSGSFAVNQFSKGTNSNRPSPVLTEKGQQTMFTDDFLERIQKNVDPSEIYTAQMPRTENQSVSVSPSHGWTVTVPNNVDSSKFSDDAKKLLSDLYEDNVDVPQSSIAAEFERFYTMGKVGLPISRATELQVFKDITGIKDAFSLGQKEYAIAQAAAREKLRTGSVTYLGKKSGLVMNEFSDTLTKQQRKTLSDTAKILGTKIILTDNIADGKADGYYKDGVIHINISDPSKVYSIARHELIHRFAETAPDLYGSYQKEALSFLSEEKQIPETDLIARKKAEYANKGKILSDIEAAEEVAAEFSKRLFDGDDTAFESLVKNNRTAAQKFLDFLRNIIENIKSVFTKKSASANNTETEISNLEALEKRYSDLFAASAKTAKGKENIISTDSDGMFVFKGVDKNGIEIYETSEDVKKLRYNDRKKILVNKIKNEYKGKTAKFFIDNTAYYASIDPKDAYKFVHGDRNSDRSGGNARTNIGAGGDIFTLFENSRYEGSAPPREGTETKKGHEGVFNYDYFVKTIQSDGDYFDVVINVKENETGKYVYTVSLKENKKMRKQPLANWPTRRSPVLTSQEAVSSFEDSIPQTDTSVNTHNTQNDGKYSFKDDDSTSELSSEGGEEASSEVLESLIRKRIDNRTVFIAEDVRPAVRKFLKDFDVPNGEISASDISEIVAESLNNMSIEDLEKGFSSNEKYNKALNIVASEIAEAARSEVSSPSSEETKLKQELKDTQFRVSLMSSYNFGERKRDFTKFRQSLLGVMPKISIVSKNDMTFDPENPNKELKESPNIGDIYSDLVERYPDKFPNGIEDEIEQLKQIAEVAKSLKKTYAPRFEEATPEIIESIKKDLLSAVLDEWSGARDSDVIREEYRQKLIEEKAEARRELEYVKEKHADEKANKKTRELQEQLLRVSRRLQRMKTTPENIKLIEETIGKLYTGDVSMSSKTKTSISQLAKKIEEYQKESGTTLALSEKMKRDISDLRSIEFDKRDISSLGEIKDGKKIEISNISTDKLQSLINAGLALENQVRNGEYLLGARKKHKIYDYAEKLAEEVSYGAKIQKVNPVSKFSKFKLSMLSPMHVARMMSGYKEGSVFVELFENISEGYKKTLSITKDVTMKFEEVFKETEKMKEITGPKAREIFAKNIVDKKDGKTKALKITPAQLIALHCLSKDDHAMYHIQDTPFLKGGGILIPDIKLLKEGKTKAAEDQGEVVNLSRREIDVLWESATPFEKRIAELVEDYMNVIAPNLINEVALVLYGFMKAGEGYYFPISTVKSLASKDPTTSFMTDAIQTVESWSHLKDRVSGANGAILLQDVFSVVDNHLKGVSFFAGLAIPLRDFKSVYGTVFEGRRESVEKTIGAEWGESAKRYIMDFIADIEGNRKSPDGLFQEIGRKLKGNAATAVLSANLSSAAKQISAFPAAAAVVGWKPVLKTATHNLVGKSVADIKTINEFSPLLWSRNKPYEFSNFYRKQGWEKRFPWLMDWLQYIDAGVARRQWSVAEHYVDDNLNQDGKWEKGSNEYNRVVAKIFEEIMERTQASREPIQLPGILRSNNPLDQLFTSFKTDAFKTYGEVCEAISEHSVRTKEFRNAEKNPLNQEVLKEARTKLDESNEKIALTISATVVKNMTTAVMGFIAKILLDKLENYEEGGEMTVGSVLKGLGIDILSDTFGSVVLGQELFDAMYSLTTHDLYYGTSNVFFGSVEKLLNSIQKVSSHADKLVDGEGSAESLFRSVENMGICVAELCKIPAGNIKNIFYGMVSNTAKAVGYDAQYAVLKARYGLGSKSRFYDLLYDAFKNDQSEYKSLKRIMLRDGFELTKINSEMKKRKNKAKSKE
ncbi:MAG: hypothetical protein J6D42_05650 [Clostridia bacterium]|nr:hypothetical protein [Clostridia bacterium]